MKVALPLFILAIGFAAAFGFFKFRPEAKETSPERPITGVEVIQAKYDQHTIWIRSQGTLLPKVETELSAEASGRILYVSEKFEPGEHFETGETLLRIDSVDYEAAVAARTADLATAKLNFALEEAQAEQALADWQIMGSGNPSDLTLRKPQIEQAKAQVKSIEAALKLAERNLDRTSVKAPYSGQILETHVDLGQYLSATPASPIARIFAGGAFEVRLPLTETEAAFLSIDSQKATEVVLRRTKSINGESEWIANLIRIEATIDPISRLIYAVAEIKPENQNDKNSMPSLRRGLFVEAKIQGRALKSAIKLPRSALRGSNSVFVVTPENTLIRRTVTVIHTDQENAFITKGLTEEELIVTSPVAYFVEAMKVEIINSQ